MPTRYVGTCPVCNGRQKVIGGKLVHHGYQRPGHGHIKGDCFSVGRVPHEVSSETAEAYRSYMEACLVSIEKAIETTKTASSLLYSYDVYEGGIGSKHRRVKYITVERGAGPATVDHNFIPSFKDVQAESLRRLEMDRRWAHGNAARMTILIDTWTEQPLTTVEEESSRMTAEKSAAKKLKSDERAAKRAVKDQKKAEREAKLQAKLDVATLKARALLDAVDPSDIKAVREAYIKVLEIKLPAVVWHQDFVEKYVDRKDLLRSAGVVRAHNGTWMDHAYEVERLILESR